MSTPPTPYFFVSYSREDTAKQRRVVKELRERGLNIWVDIENLTPGTPTWEREIEKAIRGATGIIVLLSPESNNSEWVRREISFGEQHRKRIFPVLIEGDEHASTPLRLANHQRVDLRTKFESGLDELAQAIKEYIGIKDEIAAQVQPAWQGVKMPIPLVDIKRFAIPVVIALFIIGAVVTAFNITINDHPRDDATATNTATDVDEDITATPPQNDKPTGKIIYTCEIQGAEVCIINADGSGWKRLTDSQFANFNASLSPDGTEAVYIVSDGKTSEIHELNVTTGNSKQVTNLQKSLGSPEISPDERYIVFHYRSGSSNLQIWMMNRDGSSPYEFYSEGNKDIHDATWSPDGKQLVFALGKAENNKLYMIDFNGRDPRLLNNSIDTRGRSDWGLGDLIVFDAGGPWAHDVYIMNLDGSGLRQVSPKGMNAQGASLSPDGNWIAFTAYTDVAGQDQESCEILIMRVDGSDVRQLTNNNYCDYQPRWGD